MQRCCFVQVATIVVVLVVAVDVIKQTDFFGCSVYSITDGAVGIGSIAVQRANVFQDGECGGIDILS